MVSEQQPSGDQTKGAAKASTPARPAEAWNLPDSSRDRSLVGWIPVHCYRRTIKDQGSMHNVLIQGSVVVIRQFLIFINQTFLMVSVALVTMVD